MTAPSSVEAWLGGPVPGIDPVLMPAVHALLQARRDLERAALGTESNSGATADQLIAAAEETIDRVLEQLRRTPAASVFDPRPVGRAALPSNVLGLLFHAAEHTTRHVGQLITTLWVVRGAP